MKIDIVTLFPEMFVGPFDESIVKRARQAGLVEINIHNLRDWAEDKHKIVDDRPYGGGPGMVMKVDVIGKSIEALKIEGSKVLLMSAKGERYTQQKAVKVSDANHLVLICGHYEGVDHRVHELVDDVISVGDFVLTGGEIASMIVVDSVVRLIPGVLGGKESASDESHKKPGYIEYPQYTRPEEYMSMNVPKVLLSGNHGEIEKWREENSGKN
ncbi:tRNA (guanosine(37)-N1)-methyltransferase TrmD [Patescibacteria group bacterium]